MAGFNSELSSFHPEMGYFVHVFMGGQVAVEESKEDWEQNERT